MSLYDNGIRMSSREAEATLIYQESNKCNVRQMTDEEKARYGSMDGSGDKQTTATVPSMTPNNRSKTRVTRYCPGCSAEKQLKYEQLEEPVTKCLKCDGNFETDLWRKKLPRTQIQGDGGAVPSTGTEPSAPVELQPKSEPVKDLNPDQGIDDGWQAATDAKHKAEHEAWKAKQAELQNQRPPDPEIDAGQTPDYKPTKAPNYRGTEWKPAILTDLHVYKRTDYPIESGPQQNTNIRDEIMQKLTELTGLIGHLYTEGRKDGCREGYTKAMDDMTAAIRTLGVDSVMLGGGC